MLKHLIIFICCLFNLVTHSSLHCSDDLPLDSRYTLEVEDPYHRHVSILQAAYNLWKRSYSDVHESFWEFLVNEQHLLQNDYPALYDPAYHMLWLDTPESRSAYEVIFIPNQEGELTVWNRQEGLLPDGKWIYVEKDDTFYVTQEKKHKIHHSSLSAGENVTMAGVFIIKQGILNKITFVSGHYRPSMAAGLKCIERLLLLHPNFSHLKVSYRDVYGNKFKTDVPTFLQEAKHSSQKNLGEKMLEPFLDPFDLVQRRQIPKAKLFLAQDGRLYIGNRELEFNDPLCALVGEIYMTALVKIENEQIIKVLFGKDIKAPNAVTQMQAMIASLVQYGVDVNNIRFRIINDGAKLIVSADDILTKRT